jgi:hypothetical protein
VSGTSWGGHTGEKLWLNVFQWYWAIADRGSPADVAPADLADILGVSLEEAARIVAAADRGRLRVEVNGQDMRGFGRSKRSPAKRRARP